MIKISRPSRTTRIRRSKTEATTPITPDRCAWSSPPTSSVPSTMSPVRGSTAAMPNRAVSPSTASSVPPTSVRGPATTRRPPISKVCTAAEARAAATKAGAASSAEDSTTCSPSSGPNREPSAGLVSSITSRTAGLSSSTASATRIANTSSSPTITAALARVIPARRSSAGRTCWLGITSAPISSRSATTPGSAAPWMITITRSPARSNSSANRIVVLLEPMITT
jgi:hypothetical protein